MTKNKTGWKTAIWVKPIIPSVFAVSTTVDEKGTMLQTGKSTISIKKKKLRINKKIIMQTINNKKHKNGHYEQNKQNPGTHMVKHRPFRLHGSDCLGSRKQFLQPFPFHEGR